VELNVAPKKKQKKIINIKNESKLNIYSRVSVKKYLLSHLFFFVRDKCATLKI
jgi:hypothetical protein